MTNKPPKLTRKQVKEGLEAVPIETILLGTAQAQQTTMTASQKEFAYQIAIGKTKAEAYRQSRPNGRKSKAKPETASKRGQELAKVGAIQGQIEAFRVALEAQKYQTPAHLRALCIHKLTEHAINPDNPPAQQIRALELIAKFNDVSLFTEQRELVTIDNPQQMRDKILTSIRLALASQKSSDVEIVEEADSLLAELSLHHEAIDQQNEQNEPAIRGESDNIGQTDDPTDPIPPEISKLSGQPLHSIPHKQSQNFDGEGVQNSQQASENVSRETPPLSNPTENGGGE
jgi:hypothetical protein